MHKLIIKYNKQLKMLNLRDGKTYTISEDERADITLKSLGEVIHLEQNNQGTWQANHTSINKVLVRKVTLMTLHYSFIQKLIMHHLRILQFKIR
ncbi:essC protein [Staphylococcus aureus subsp. aureus 091751]|nr:hypothetical protein RL06_08280 [Staphylococcus aureus]AVG68216.1 hypothetical protein RK60_00625 [Staphylococcus aureus]EOR35832.1 essC protein [Staphylococcus aureus subsp. aureus 091751]